MKCKKTLFFIFGIFFYSFTVSGIVTAQNTIPSKLIQEKNNFLDSQINQEDKEFLKKLSQTFIDIEKLNAATLSLFEITYFPKQQTRDFLMPKFENMATEILNSLEANKTVNSIELFIDTCLENDTLLKSRLNEVIAKYHKCQSIDELLSPLDNIGAAGLGTLYYYGIYLGNFENKFGESLQNFMKENTAKYARLANISQKREIVELQKLLTLWIKTTEDAQSNIKSAIIEKMELSNKGWAKNAIDKTLELLQKQLEFNKDFLLVISKKMKRIPIPQQPMLPDLVINSLQINAPAKTKVGNKVTIFVEVKNIGHLTADSSQVKVTFPDKRIKRKNIPALKGGDSYTFKFRYKIRKMGANVFNAAANCNDKAWEFNTNNNKVKRALLLLK